MGYAIRGQIWDASAPTQTLDYVSVRMLLGVGTEFDEQPTTSSRPSPALWSASVGANGYFTIQISDEEAEAILAGRRHREVIFKIYSSNGVIIGSQAVYISFSTLRGTEMVTLSADPTTIPSTSPPSFAVTGFVVQADGAPVVSTVVALDIKQLRTSAGLGSATTDSAGRFLIRYSTPSGSHPDQANFSVVLSAPGASATTGDFCNPPSDFTVRLVEDNDAYRGRSDFDLDVATISPLLDGAALDEFDVDDIKFVMCRTQHDSSTLALLARTHALAVRHSLPAAAFAALAHAGIPLSTTSVTGLSATEITSAISQAVTANAVPSSLTAQLPTIISVLAAARIDRIVPAIDPGSTPLGSILVAAGLASGQPRAFAEAYAAHTTSAEQFWSTLRTNPAFTSADVDRIQFALQNGAISGGHAPLVKLLDQKRTNGDFSVAAELAQYDESDWVTFLGQLVDGNPVHTPPGMAGVDDTEKRANYAAAMTRMIADLYPSAHLAYRLPTGSVTADVADFVIQNPGFSFERTNINEFLDTANGLPPLPADEETLRQDLLKVQRVFAISPRYGRTNVAATLLDEEVASAAQIHSMGYSAFKAKFSGLMDAKMLASTYQKAEKMATAVVNSWLFMRPEMHFPPLAVIPPPRSSNPDIQAKLDSRDYCACPPCESVLGPAAYFLDIMQFLYRRGPGIMSRLASHRPELLFVDLSCENSDTPLPTIDLINEVLESRAHSHLGVPGSYSDRQTTWSADDLLVYPENIHLGVYDKLADPAKACFPLNLPFDLPHAEARAYLQAMGTSRLEIQDALEWFDGLSSHQAFRVDERLNLSPGAGEIVRFASLHEHLEVLWGFAQDDPQWQTKINDVETFLAHAGLTFDELKELLLTRDLIDHTEILFDKPCSLKNARLVESANHANHGLDWVRLETLQSFLRLRRSLGWTIPELDATSRALDLSFISAGMDKLSTFLRLRQRFERLPLAEVLSWFAPLDRQVYDEGRPSYYDEVVRPRVLNAAFIALDGNTQLGAAKSDLLAVLRIDEASLAAIYSATGLSDTSALDLANLSTLYRVNSIAVALELSIADLVTFTKFTQTLDVVPGAFAGTPTAPVQELVDVVLAVKSSGFSVTELDWILRNTKPEKFQSDDVSVMGVLIGLIVALQQAASDYDKSLPLPHLAVFERLEKLLTSPIGEEKVGEAMRFVRKETDPPPADFMALRKSLLFFLEDGSPAAEEFDTTFGPADTAENRALKLEQELLPWLRRQILERVVVQQLAVAFSLDVAETDTLLRTFDSNTALATLTADTFFDKSSFDSEADASLVQERTFPRVFLARTNVGPAAVMFRALLKVALISSKFRLGPDLLRWLLVQPSDAQVKLPNLVNLKLALGGQSLYDGYSGWDWLRRAIRLRDALFSSSTVLADILASFFVPNGFSKSAVLAELALAAGWDPTDLQAFELLEAITQNDLKRLDAVEAFAAAFRLSALLGVQPGTVRNWAKLPITSTVAATIRGATRAKLGGPGWTGVARPIRDRLRVQQRDALADYIVHKEGLKTREDLFGLLLMDVDMSPCNRTTRLLFTTAAVQLFVQRALMGLVDNVVLSDEDAAEWAWMKRYRVWEANRKIFLYPENWVLPELRDDKTSLFKQLEEELSQSEVDEASVEKAFIHYLEGLRELAHLQPSGMYHEIEDGVVDRMHVFAHSHADPSKMFYRRRENSLHWTAWEELPFQVDHKGVLPLVVNRRLMLIWPHIDVRPERPAKFNNSDTNTPTPEEYPEISLRWAEQMNDTWSGVYCADERVSVASYTPYDKYPPRFDRSVVHLTSDVTDDKLRIRVHCPATFTFNEVASFHLNACRNKFELIEAPSHKTGQNYEVHKQGGSSIFWNQAVRILALNDWSIENYSVSLGYDGFNDSNEPIIVMQKTPSTLLFPRQDAFHDVSRPFVFSDEDVALYMYPITRTGRADSKPESQYVHEVGQQNIIPYLGAAGVTTNYQPPPPDADLLMEMSGGDNVMTQKSLSPDSWGNGYMAAPFYHPFACLFIERVRRFGVGGLLDPIMAAQIDDASLLYQAVDWPLKEGHDYFEGIEALKSDSPRATIDFSPRGAYSVYNWEIFFHIPMLVADRLMAERRFGEAQRWLGYIFNPLRKPTEVDDKVHFWGLKPFREASEDNSIEWLLELLHYDGPNGVLNAKKQDMIAQIERFRTNPFRPHDLARARPTAYMRAVVMKYLDNLIAWGDDLFRQDTRESNQEAAQLYILALQILGPRPRKLDDEDRPDKNWTEAVTSIDDFSNFLVQLENDHIGYTGQDAMVPHDKKAQADYQLNYPSEYKFVFVNSPYTQSIVNEPPTFVPCQPMSSLNAFAAADDDGPVGTRLYFCIPPNDKLLGYWDTVADRLFKLRNCLNIEGIRRDLPLYDPPIDPALLARAVAQGIDIGTAISNLHAPLPHYRFLPHLSIAKDFAAQVSSLGGALLQALEKRDAEHLAVLRNGQEVDLLKLVRGAKERAIHEAEENLEALRRGREVAVLREQYYSTREFMNELESTELALSLEASGYEKSAAKYHRNAAMLVALVPGVSVGFSGAWPTISFSSGGGALAWGSQSAGDRLNTDAQQKSREAARAATQASYTRRKEDWDFQETQATADLRQIDVQITAAEIRRQMAEIELANHDKQTEQASETLAFMQSKFTNAELYSWMASELGKVYHLAYQLALDLGRRAERCYRYELAVDAETPEFVQFGHWDNRRQGLLAGERLAHDLRRMEAAYYEHNRRDYELTKRVSLASLDPVALIALRKTGACHFNLPSILFNLDHASHYLRRIKLVGVSIPAVTGPYTNIGVTLTYEAGEIRRTPNEVPPLTADTGVQFVAISVSQEDTGLFEPNLRDERYLPFEGRALENSKWRLDLPNVVRQFDYETISDVILTVRYTAREGGSTTSGIVTDNQGLENALNDLSREEPPENVNGQAQIFSARAEFPEAWRTFIAAGSNGDAVLNLDLSEQRFPHPQPLLGTRTIEGILLFARWSADDSVAPAPNTTVFVDSVLTPQGGPAGTSFTFTNFQNQEPATSAKHNYLWVGTPTLGVNKSPGTWTLQVPGWQNGHAPEDIIIVVAHKVS